MIEPVPRRLGQYRGKPGKDFGHDRFRNDLKAFPVPSVEIKCARLVTTNHAVRSCHRVERNRETATPCEVSTRSDRKNDRCTGQLVEGCWGYDHDRPRSLLFMADCGVEADEPDFATLHSGRTHVALTDQQDRVTLPVRDPGRFAWGSAPKESPPLTQRPLVHVIAHST